MRTALTLVFVFIFIGHVMLHVAYCYAVTATYNAVLSVLKLALPGSVVTSIATRPTCACAN